MQSRAYHFSKVAALAVILVLAAGCADDPQKKSEQPQAAQPPVVANAAQVPVLAAPEPEAVPVPAYGPNPHPHYYYPPTGGISMPGTGH